MSGMGLKSDCATNEGKITWEAAVTPEEMEAQIISLREQVFQIQEQLEDQRKHRLLWSRTSVGVGGALMVIAGLAVIFLPSSPMITVLFLLALFTAFQSRAWL
jgi:hypothetical protein